MPYKVQKRGKKFAVTHGGKTFGTHPTKSKAQKQVRAIYANSGEGKGGQKRGGK